MSPSKTAIVCCPAASVPAPGSVKPKAPIFLPVAKSFKYFSFWSLLPNWSIKDAHKDVWAETITPVVAHTFDNSSTAIMY